MILKLKNTNFINRRSPISISNIDINRVILSINLSFSKKDFKNFIGYKDDKKFRSSCMHISSKTGYIKKRF